MLRHLHLALVSGICARAASLSTGAASLPTGNACTRGGGLLPAVTLFRSHPLPEPRPPNPSAKQPSRRCLIRPGLSLVQIRKRSSPNPMTLYERHNFSTIEQRIFVAMVAQLDREMAAQIRVWQNLLLSATGRFLLLKCPVVDLSATFEGLASSSLCFLLGYARNRYVRLISLPIASSRDFYLATDIFLSFQSSAGAALGTES